VARQRSRVPGAAELVFLHEGLGSIGLWRDVPQRLHERTGHGVVVVSRFGNGFSQPLETARDVRYMHDEALTGLPALLRALEIERPILVGHSDGASIALIFAGAHPQNVAGLIVEAPHVFVEEMTLRSIAAAREAFIRGELRERLVRHHADVDRTFFGWNDIWLDPRFREWNIEEYLPPIGAPILAVQGGDDAYGSLAQLDALCARCSGPVDRLVLAHCGHAPHRERPLMFETAVAGWLDERFSTMGGVDSARRSDRHSERS
jgi:pimeloyl-ACP methyl ester carboxylesterase